MNEDRALARGFSLVELTVGLSFFALLSVLIFGIVFASMRTGKKDGSGRQRDAIPLLTTCG